MAIYERYNARIGNTVRLRRNFYNDGVLFDPYKIDKIEIWKTRFDLEFEHDNPGTLLVDTIYGSRIILGGITNNAYGTLGLEAGTISPETVQLTEYEQSFTGVTSIIITHNLNDHYPIVTVYNSLNVVIVPNSIVSLDANRIQLTFATAQSGTVDIVGATGIGVATPTAVVKKYTESFNNQISLTVHHNLNDMYPNVSIYDSDYNWIFPSVIQTIDANTIVVTFSSAQTGTINVLGGNVGFSISGFGAAATVVGTNKELFSIQGGVNNQMLISIDGGIGQAITLPTNCAGAQASDIVTVINSQLVGGTAFVVDGAVGISTNTVGATGSIDLQSVAHSSYTTLGFTTGLVQGLGFPPAVTEGGATGAYTITPTTNLLQLNIDGSGPTLIDLLEGDNVTKRITGNRIAAIISSALVLGSATMDSTRRLQITGTTSVEIQAIANNAYTELGLIVGTYGPSYTGSTVEYFIFTSTNNRLQIIVNYQGAVDVILPIGNLTIFQVVSEINNVFIANNINAIAEVTTSPTGGRLRIRALVNDGITRTGLGQYYADYIVPTNWLSNGVLLNEGLDVWYYAPIVGYLTDIPDDTDNFIVYADKYFLDSGFGNYDFAFTLMRDLFYVGEKRPMITKVVPLPRYKTPVVNDWILPLSNSQYRVLTDENSLIQDWTDTDLNSGTEIRVSLDTTVVPYNREGVYNLQLRVNIPNGEVLMSNRLKFRITNK